MISAFTMIKLIFFVGLFVICAANVVRKNTEDNIFNEKLVEGVVNDGSRQGRSFKAFTSLWACGADASCWLDKGEAFVEQKRNQFLVEADSQAAARSLSTGRKSEQPPSALANTVQKLINEVSEAIRNSLAGFFAEYREADDNGIQDDDDEARGLNGEARKKKKKPKLKTIIRFLILGAVIKAKLTVLLHLLSAGLQIKFFLIALAGLLLNLARFWLDLKKGHNPQKVIYYEHAQHQHHYDHLDDEHGGGGGWWGRAYEEEDGKDRNSYAVDYSPESGNLRREYAQEQAYRGQKPVPWQ